MRYCDGVFDFSINYVVILLPIHHSKNRDQINRLNICGWSNES